MVQLCKTPLLVRHGFHWCHVTLTLPCISLTQPLLIFQFATGATAVTAGTSVIAGITGTGTGTATDITAVVTTAAAAGAAAATVVVVTDAAATI
jgi:hypothetical protein